MPHNPIKDAGRAALHVRRDLLALLDDLAGRGLIDRFIDEDVSFYSYSSLKCSCIIKSNFLCNPKIHDKVKEIRLAVFAFTERVADEFAMPVDEVRVNTKFSDASLWIHRGRG